MEVNGITRSYMSEKEYKKTTVTSNGRDFEKAVNRAEQDNISWNVTENDSEKPIFRWLYSADGSTGEVYKAQDYTLEHPVYKIKSWDATGNLTEHVIDVSQVDPKNCNTYEMYAYAANLKETGKGSFEETVMHAASAKAAAGAEQKTWSTWDYSKRINWTETVQEMMQSAYDFGDFKGYLAWKKFLGFLK